MSAAEKFQFLTEEEYLAQELISDTKHEYVGGVIFEMVGATNRHNRIALRCTTALSRRILGKGPCEPFNSDTKVRVPLSSGTRFYYPDALVVCEPNSEDESFQDAPALIIEVLSKSTRRTDLTEKKEAYFALPSLGVYLTIEQHLPRVVAHRRIGAVFTEEIYEGLDAIIQLPEIDTELPLAEIYDGISFSE